MKRASESKILSWIRSVSAVTNSSVSNSQGSQQDSRDKQANITQPLESTVLSGVTTQPLIISTVKESPGDFPVK